MGSGREMYHLLELGMMHPALLPTCKGYEGMGGMGSVKEMAHILPEKMEFRAENSEGLSPCTQSPCTIHATLMINIQRSRNWMPIRALIQFLKWLFNRDDHLTQPWVMPLVETFGCFAFDLVGSCHGATKDNLAGL
jgi:hypothetical protein